MIFTTNNGGSSWSLSDSKNSSNLNSIYFFDSQNGIVVGDAGTILITGNGGLTWTKKNIGSTSNFKSVSFIGSDGFIAGSMTAGFGTIYKTTDKGITWSQVTGTGTQLLPQADINCVYFNFDYDEIDIFEMGPGTRNEDCSGNGVILSDVIMTNNSWITGLGSVGCNLNIVGKSSNIPTFTDWRKFALEWSPSKLIYYVDDRIVSIRPNPGYDPVKNSGAMLSQKTNVIFGLGVSQFVKWNAKSIPNTTPPTYYWPKWTSCYGNSSEINIFSPCNLNYSDYFVSGSVDDNNPPYPGYNSGTNPQYSVNTTSNPSSWPFMKIQGIKYYQLDNSTCGLSLSLNTIPLWNAAYTVRKNITISGISPTQAKVLRASEFVDITDNFTSSGTELYIDVNPCY